MSLDPEMDLVKLSYPYFVRYKGWSSTKQILEWGYSDKSGAAAKAQADSTPIESSVGATINGAANAAGSAAAASVSTPSAAASVKL
jgi:hypothetical protein